MKFDQMMEKIEVEEFIDYEHLIFSIDEENKIEYSDGRKYWYLIGMGKVKKITC